MRCCGTNEDYLFFKVLTVAIVRVREYRSNLVKRFSPMVSIVDR